MEEINMFVLIFISLIVGGMSCLIGNSLLESQFEKVPNKVNDSTLFDDDLL